MDLNKDLKNINFNPDLSTIVTVYKQYKNFFLPIAIIAASIVLFFVILIPQVQGVISAKEEEQVERQKLETLKNSYNNLTNMNQETLGSKLESLTRALSNYKDFAGIINSISSNSVKTGVLVGNFEFSVGDVSKSTEGVAFPSIQITLNLSGSPKATLDFMKSLYESVPLAEVTSIKTSGDASTLKVQFYYKSYPQISINNSSPIALLSEKENSTITTVSSWGDNVSASLLPLGLEGSLDENQSSGSPSSSRANPFE